MEYAIFEDCRNLIEQFVLDGDGGFSSFCKQWKKLQFQHIYFAQTSHTETMQTTAAVIYYAKHELCVRSRDNSKSITSDSNAAKNTTAQHYTEEEVRRRIGCLFLLYAIYFKQPTEQFIKIETNPNTWRIIKNFINTLPMSEDMDSVRYVFFRLLEADAFRFTALNYCVGLEELVDYDQLNDKENTEFLSKISGKELGQQLQDFPATQRILPALTVLEEGYNEMKEMLIKTNPSGMHKKSLPTTTIFKSIEQCFQNIQSILDDDDGRMKKYKSLSTDNSRRSLKRKGFSGKAIDAKDERGTNEGANTGKKKYNSLRRMSARTIFTEKLPAVLLSDLEDQDETSMEENMETMESSENEVKESFIELEKSKQDNISKIAKRNLVYPPKEEQCEQNPPKGNEEETIEKHLNELLEIELTEEFISLPPYEKK